MLLSEQEKISSLPLCQYATQVLFDAEQAGCFVHIADIFYSGSAHE